MGLWFPGSDFFTCCTPAAKSILGRVGETGEIASVIYLTSFAQNCLLSIPCTLSLASAEARWLGTRLCSWQCLKKWGSQWVPGFPAAHPFVMMGQTYCSTGRAPSFARPAEQGGKACGGQSGVGDASRNRWWEGKSGEWRMTKKETHKQYFNYLFWIYSEAGNAEFSVQAVSCTLHSSQGQAGKQEKVLYSKHRGSRPHWGNGGVKDWRCASHSRFILKRSENLPLHLRFSWLQSQESLSSSFKPIHCQLFRARR